MKLIVKNWSLLSQWYGFAAPETKLYCLWGKVTNDFESYKEENEIITTRIIHITKKEIYAIIQTKYGEYIICPQQINSEYENCFPGAYGRLSTW